jgi:chitosanase
MSDAILEKKNKIEQIVNVFETGSIEGNYADVSIFNDGPNRIKQITYGRSQTTEWGKLGNLIEAYTKTNGSYVNFFKPYLSKIGKVSLVNDKKFISNLKLVGKEKLMQETQDAFFDLHYWKYAAEFMKENGFITPLAGLVIYDSFIHSGGILAFLRNRFSERPPVRGGDEKKWIEQYLHVRHEWLENHSNKILNKTIYRTRDMIKAASEDNWNLNSPFSANGIIVK